MLKIFICVTARLRLLFLLQETLLRVAFLLLGSLSEHNDDDNNNVKRQLILWAKQQLCKCITLCSTFLWRSRRHDYHVKPPNATFYGGHQHTTTNFPIFLEPGLKKNPGKIAYIWQIERVQRDAKRFERTQIYFVSDVSPSSSLLKFPVVDYRCHHDEKRISYFLSPLDKCLVALNPWSPKSDQHQISPCNINAL